MAPKSQKRGLSIKEVTEHKKRSKNTTPSTSGSKDKDAQLDVIATKGKEIIELPEDRKPKKKKSQHVGIKPYDSYPTLLSRTSPSTLSKAFTKMNKKQKQIVMEMGFGPLFHINATELPLKLAYWILENFDETTCEIKLAGSRRLHIEEADIQLILGLPRGSQQISRRLKGQESNMTTEWRERFVKFQNRILAKDVCKDMLAQTHGGEWFKRQFLVLVNACLVETLGNCYVSPQIMDSLEDVDNAVNLNWCQYLIRSLVDNATMWKKNKVKYFSGPTLFLTLFYLDRVVLRCRTVVRSIPATIAWNGGLMVERQIIEANSGGFGLGYPEKACKYSELYHPSQIDDTLALLFGRKQVQQVIPPTPDVDAAQKGSVSEEDSEDDDHRSEGDSENNDKGLDDVCEENHDDEESEEQQKTSQDEIHTLVTKILNIANNMTEMMEKIMAIVSSVPKEMLKNVVFRRAIDAALMVERTPVCSLESTSRVNPTSTPLDDEFWGNPDHLAEIAKIEKAALERDELKRKIDEVPTFSLGLGLELPDNLWRGVMDVIEDINLSEQEKIEGKKNETEKDEAEKNNKDAQDNIQHETVIQLGDQTQEEIEDQIMTEKEAEKEVEKETEKEAEKELEKEIEKASEKEHDIENVIEKELQSNNETEKRAEGESESDEMAHKKKAKGKGKGKRKSVEENVTVEVEVKETLKKQKKQKDIVVDQEPRKMMTRKAHERKVTEKLISPNQRRAIMPTESLDKKGKDIYFWLMRNPEAKMEEIVYFDGRVSLPRNEMLSMRAGLHISTSVIDVWSNILNHNEHLRAKSAPRRFFATTMPCMYTIVDGSPGWDNKKRMEVFCKRLLEEIKDVKGLKVEDVDLFFFPICQSSHLYLIVIDANESNAYVIDNSSALDDEPLLKYGDIPTKLVEFVTHFLIANGDSKRGNYMLNHMEDVVRMKMPWRNDTNKVDCGAYLMRHMETYKGNGLLNWKCGLKTDNEKQMKYLRVKYCAAIITANINILKDEIVARSNWHYRISCEEYTIDVDNIIMTVEKEH